MRRAAGINKSSCDNASRVDDTRGCVYGAQRIDVGDRPVRSAQEAVTRNSITILSLWSPQPDPARGYAETLGEITGAVRLNRPLHDKLSLSSSTAH